MNPPRKPEPPYSCPNLDGAIAEIEAARKIHDDLRHWAGEWKDAYYDLVKELTDRIEEIEAERDAAEERANDLERELESVREELAAYTTSP